MAWEYLEGGPMPVLFDVDKNPQLLAETQMVVRALQSHIAAAEDRSKPAINAAGKELQQQVRLAMAERKALMQREREQQEIDAEQHGQGREGGEAEGGQNDTDEDAERRKGIEDVLTQESMKENVRLLHTEGGATVYLLGTAHVSSKSCDDVAALIAAVRPDTVMIELCHSRLPMILNEQKSQSTEEKEAAIKELWTKLFTALKQKGSSEGGDGIVMIVLSLVTLMASKNIDVSGGAEFRVAMQEGLRVGATVVLGDRDVKATIGRLWAQLSLYEKAKGIVLLSWAMLTGMSATEDDIEELKKNDFLEEAIREVSRIFPSVAETILAERDLFLADSIRQCPGDTIVAVVGKGHAAGIVKQWSTPVDRAALLDIPKSDPGFLARGVSWCFSSAIGGVRWVAGLVLPRTTEAAEKKEQ